MPRPKVSFDSQQVFEAVEFVPIQQQLGGRQNLCDLIDNETMAKLQAMNDGDGPGFSQPLLSQSDAASVTVLRAPVDNYLSAADSDDFKTTDRVFISNTFSSS
eukprot:3361065-Karenia_brevis.AAC.1